MPEIKKIEGIVIGDTNYSESSKILNILTKDYGIIGVMSKGCRKVKSNLRTVSTKLIYGDFNVYYKDNGLSTLISVDLKRYYKNIMTDIIKISYATYLIELSQQTYKQNPSTEIYNLLKNFDFTKSSEILYLSNNFSLLLTRSSSTKSVSLSDSLTITLIPFSISSTSSSFAERIVSPQPLIAVRGVRISCETLEINSFFIASALESSSAI